MTTTTTEPAGARCAWASDELLIDYHDNEWGVPVHDDRRHFEFLVLEAAQAGLSWRTVLARRDGYRRVFASFDPEIVASFDASRIEELLTDTGIIRNRLKVESSVHNAGRVLEVQAELGSFDAYLWSFVDGTTLQHAFSSMDQLPAFDATAEALSKDLKRRGFRFVGPTVVYAHLQAAGLVNDHVTSCPRWQDLC